MIIIKNPIKEMLKKKEKVYDDFGAKRKSRTGRASVSGVQVFCRGLSAYDGVAHAWIQLVQNYRLLLIAPPRTALAVINMKAVFLLFRYRRIERAIL